VKWPSSGPALGVAAVSAAVAAVGAVAGQTQLAGHPHPDIWSNAWFVSAIICAGAGLLIAVVIFIAAFLGRRSVGAEPPSQMAVSRESAGETSDAQCQAAASAARQPGRENMASSENPPLGVAIKRTQWENWRQRSYIVALQVEITNATCDSIQLGPTELESNWDDNFSSGIPLLSGPERLDLEREMDAVRRRYSPELRAYTHAPSGKSISGWIVAAVPCRARGGTPRLTISVSDLFGNQYLARVEGRAPQIFPESS
jgi:hypothetical protein